MGELLHTGEDSSLFRIFEGSIYSATVCIRHSVVFFFGGKFAAESTQIDMLITPDKLA